MDVDPDLVFAIILVENPKLEEYHINVNANKTADLGIMQLNSKYLWKDFLPRYWHTDTEFNPFNWQHSIYIGIYHIQFLHNNVRTLKKTIMAYNCGLVCVKRNKVPESTIKYSQLVMKKYKQLKSGKLNQTLVLN
jgi:hypothetical protein